MPWIAVQQKLKCDALPLCENILPQKSMCHGGHFYFTLLGHYVYDLSSPRLVCGHVLEAYQCLPGHPVTLQRRTRCWGAFPCRTGLRRAMDRGGGRQAIVFVLLRWIVPSRSNIQRVVGGTGSLTWSEETVRLRQRRYRREKRGVRESKRSLLFLHC